MAAVSLSSLSCGFELNCTQVCSEVGLDDILGIP